MMRRVMLLAACLVAVPAMADDKWEVTTSFEMAGMPFQMPPQTHTLCLAPGDQNSEKLVPTDKNCKVTRFSTSGNTSRFRVECSAPQKMVGDGEITRSKDSYQGRLHAKGNMDDGQSMDMTIQYAGRKVGSCAASENTLTQAKAMQKKAEAMMQMQQAQTGQMCQQMAANLASWQAADSMSTTCPTLKADLCKQAKPLLSGDPDALRNLADQTDWRGLAQYCGIEPGALQAKACGNAKKQHLWGAVAEFCGNEAEALAEEHCSGRSYSVIMVSEYGPLCEKYSDKVRVTGTNSGGGAGNAVNRAIDGVNKLRSLFGR